MWFELNLSILEIKYCYFKYIMLDMALHCYSWNYLSTSINEMANVSNFDTTNTSAFGVTFHYWNNLAQNVVPN